MEESNGSQNHSGQLGPSSVGMGVANKQNHEEHNQMSQYSIPGILHFIQHEWTRFEMERSQWEVERAELQARIAFLQGERKGQENLKNDLVRRIKMLEYALRQERAKFHKLKYGTELNVGDLKAPQFEDIGKDENFDGEAFLTPNCNVSWKQGRQLLRQYLQEIGYTDTIIDVRSVRVRTLLGLTPNDTDNDDIIPLVNGELPNERNEDNQGRRIPSKKIPTAVSESALMDSEDSVLATFDFLAAENVDMDEDDENLSDDMDESGSNDDDDEQIVNKRISTKTVKTSDGMDEEAETESVLSEFNFLPPDANDGGAGEARSQGDGSEWGCEINDMVIGFANLKKVSVNNLSLTEKHDDSSKQEEEWNLSRSLLALVEFKNQYHQDNVEDNAGMIQRPKRSTLQAMLANLSDDNGEEIGNNQEQGGIVSSASTPLDFIPTPELSDCGSSGGTGELRNMLWSRKAMQNAGGLPFPAGPRRPLLGGPNAEEDSIEEALGLGELAGLTVNNEADVSYDISASKEAFRKTWNAKYTLRSHFDGVRALAFHPSESVLITASEDHTLKLWNLQKTVPAKKAASLDVEPVYTFRAHVGPVLCLAMSSNGETCFSGGLDSTVRCWKIPSSNIDPYDTYNSKVLESTLSAHTDSVWGLSIHSSKMQLLSCSADGTVKLWAPSAKVPLLNSYAADIADGVPTSVDFVRCDPAQMVVGYTSSNSVIFDLETRKPIIKLEIDANTKSEGKFSTLIHKIVSHPTYPLTITAHEDKNIRFFDNNTGKMVHSMVAHLDAVTSLAVDPNGLYLLSGSHDCSIRLWNLDNKTCVQEITAHRKKFDESIFDVAFHPSKPYIASAGSDALAKVFV
ncbi:Striatin-3 [Nymphon striatum]|nr:Striatin-3 [Nymphon striatum]